MSEDEQLKLLATDGMLVKRPIIITDDVVGVNGVIVSNLVNQFDAGSIRYGDGRFNHHWLVDRVECSILVDEVQASSQLTLLTFVVGR